MKKLVYTLLVFFFCFSANALSQNPQWVIYDTINSGLPSEWIYCMTIDESNIKWIGSHTYLGFGGHQGDGLTKFDNSQWTVYDTLNSGLPSNSVNDILLDSEGNKWIATLLWWEPGENGGLAKFDGLNWTVYDTSNSEIPTNDISCIAIDDFDNKWVGTWYDGLALFDNTYWTVYDTSNSELPSNLIICIAIDSSGNKWIGTDEGLVKIDGLNWTVYNSSNSGLPDNLVSCLAIDEINNKWIGSGGRWSANSGNLDGKGFTIYDDSNWTVFDTSNSGLPSNDVSFIAFEDSVNTWIGTWGGGLARFDDIDWDIFNTSNSDLPGNSVDCIVIDEYDNKWIGTFNGLAVFNESGIVSVDEENIFQETIPNDYLLSQNYPNPFNPSTTIKYQIPELSFVEIKIYDVLGNEITSLINEEKPAGTYEIKFNSHSGEVRNLPSGVYFYQLRADSFVETKKMVLLK